MDEILKILETQGKQQYGNEPVSQLEHALQCATLATLNGAKDTLITACLLHDLGHLLELGDAAVASDCHESRALPLLHPWFDAAVTEPIRLHVEAKRYLCAVDANYWNRLSAASKQSLEQQGGILAIAATQQFAAQPYAEDTIQLRLWDDQAKVVAAQTLHLFDFVAVMQRCLRSP